MARNKILKDDLLSSFLEQHTFFDASLIKSEKSVCEGVNNGQKKDCTQLLKKEKRLKTCMGEGNG
jgi:hypothetical protein